jgi:hypothetical protein
MICGARAVLAQKDVDQKTNEITQVKPLLDDMDITWGAGHWRLGGLHLTGVVRVSDSPRARLAAAPGSADARVPVAGSAGSSVAACGDDVAVTHRIVTGSELQQPVEDEPAALRAAPVEPEDELIGSSADAPPRPSPGGCSALLVLEDQPGAQVRRGPFTTGQASSRHLAICSSSRSAARRAGTCTVHYADIVCRGFCGPGSPDAYRFASTYQGGRERGLRASRSRSSRSRAVSYPASMLSTASVTEDPFRVVVTGPEEP